MVENMPAPAPSGMVAAMQPPTPHDSFFKAAFSDPANAAGLVRHLVRRSIASRIDWSTMQLVPGSFVAPDLRGRHSDLLFTARCSDKEVLIYILLEHQSTDDPLMAFRVLVYMIRIWERCVRERPAITRLPAILPLVVHHSRQGWTSPTSFAELFDLTPEALAAMAPHLPSFSFVLDDLRAASDASLRRRAMTTLGRLALFCLRHASNPDELVRGLGRWVDLIRELRAAPGGQEALELMWRYVFTVSAPPSPEALVERLLLVVGEEEKEEIVTAAEQLMERGREQGRVMEQREILLEQLRVRFGAMESAVEARVLAADPAQLRRWLLRFATAATVAEVFAQE
ncbi:MAG: Rpn family recombination-promoting nuclease/putative transposase [Minicystis sp.]